jgi:palmitoyltransferase
MDDPTAIVKQKTEPASSSVVTESAVATNLTFSQPKEANSDPEVGFVNVSMVVH